jgi:PAS domain S-box-containing protein
MKEKSTYRSPTPKTFIVAAIFLVLIFWIIEAALHTFVFHQDGNFLRHLVMPSLHELWMRSLVVALTVIIMLLFYYVSRHRQMESALKQSEEKFHSLFNQASDSIFLIRPNEDDLIIEDVNEAGCNTHGYTREELIGMSIGMLDNPETRKHIPERLSILMSGNPLNVEAMHVRKDGSTFPIEIAAQRIQIGENPYILAIDRDITKRKKAEMDLLAATKNAEDERAKLDAVINGLGVGLIIQDLNYKVIYENEFQQNAIGNHVGELCHMAPKHDRAQAGGESDRTIKRAACNHNGQS